MQLTLGQRLHQSEVFGWENVIRLGILSFMLTLVNVAESYYLQRVVDVYNEANLIAQFFFSYGPIGYILYFPASFFGTYAVFLVLWGCASYVLWYYRNFMKGKSPA